jgi:hypothetical protein
MFRRFDRKTQANKFEVPLIVQHKPHIRLASYSVFFFKPSYYSFVALEVTSGALKQVYVSTEYVVQERERQWGCCPGPTPAREAANGETKRAAIFPVLVSAGPHMAGGDAPMDVAGASAWVGRVVATWPPNLAPSFPPTATYSSTTSTQDTPSTPKRHRRP